MTLAPSNRPSSGLLFPLASEVLATGAKFRFRARGGSMMPFILGGDVLTIAPLSNFPLFGDVVAFRHPDTGKLTVHRVVRTDEIMYLMQGDAVNAADGWVHAADIIGRVVMIERAGRSVHFGLGAERIAIAWMRRFNFLWRLLRIIGRAMKY